MLNSIAIDLQLYKIFKIVRVSLFRTQCTTLFGQLELRNDELVAAPLTSELMTLSTCLP